MTQTNHPADSADRFSDVVEIENQVRVAHHWTPAQIRAQLIMRPDGRATTPPLVAALGQNGNFVRAIHQLFAQLPNLLRDAIRTEPVRPWSALVVHNTRTLQNKIDLLMSAFTETAATRVALTGLFEQVARDCHDEATHLQREVETAQVQLEQVQLTHRNVVRDLQTNRLGWLAFIMRLIKGDFLTRLVDVSNERESLAFEIDVNLAAAGLLAQTTEQAQHRVRVLKEKEQTIERAETTAQALLEQLQIRLQTKSPFLTQSVDNWAVAQEWLKVQSNGELTRSLVSLLADPETPAATPVEKIQEQVQQTVTERMKGLNVLTALETEAGQLNIPADDIDPSPVLLVGEALLDDVLVTHPRFWLSPVARPREFLFQITPSALVPFDLDNSYIGKFENGTRGFLGFVHVQLGLTRDDLHAYTHTREVFLATQADHNLFVIEELARTRNRRWLRKQRIDRIRQRKTS